MKGYPIKYSKEEISWLEANHKLDINEYHSMFCKKFNRTDVSKTNLHALRKRNGWRTGRTGQFKKGNIPSQNARPKGPNKTSFKKGNVPHNHKPVGHERISKDGYIEIKIKEPNVFEFKHRVIWTERNGEIPKGMILWFKDGDKQNCEIDNLELISREEQLARNKMKLSSTPMDIQPTLKLIAKLTTKAHCLVRNRNNIGALS